MVRQWPPCFLGPSLSMPTPAIWSANFIPRNFDGPSLSGPSISAPHDYYSLTDNSNTAVGIQTRVPSRVCSTDESSGLLSLIGNMLMYWCHRHGERRGLDVTATPGRRRICCAGATDSDEATAVLNSRCALAAAAAEHHDVKSSESSHDSSAAICYVNPIYSPARHVQYTPTS